MQRKKRRAMRCVACGSLETVKNGARMIGVMGFGQRTKSRVTRYRGKGCGRYFSRRRERGKKYSVGFKLELARMHVEGRDAAGKGGVIKRITQRMNPRICRVERVMGFCTVEEHREFLRSCPEFECMLLRSGIILIKYWFSVSDDEQEHRFQSRINDPTKRWKLSPMDLESRAHWVEYSKAKDEMFAHTDIKQAPWYVVDADDKKRARLNCIHHLLSMIPYKDLTPKPPVLQKRQKAIGYIRPPLTE